MVINKKLITIICIPVIVGILLFGIMSNNIANFFYNNGQCTYALDLYKLKYNISHNYDTLIKICASYERLNRHDDAITCFLKLCENENVEKLKKEEMINRVRDNYMMSMYKDQNKDAFYKYYKENLNKFDNINAERFSVAFDINQSKVSTNEDYKFALSECKYLIGLKEYQNSSALDYLLSQLYDKLGEPELSKQYFDKGKAIIEEYKKQNDNPPIKQ